MIKETHRHPALLGTMPGAQFFKLLSSLAIGLDCAGHQAADDYQILADEFDKPRLPLKDYAATLLTEIESLLEAEEYDVVLRMLGALVHDAYLYSVVATGHDHDPNYLTIPLDDMIVSEPIAN